MKKNEIITLTVSVIALVAVIVFGTLSLTSNKQKNEAEVTETENALEVHIAVSKPDVDAEGTTWHILLETEKGRISNAGAITVIYE